MANKVLKGISFPGLADTYTVPEAVAVETAEGCIEIQSYISDTIETEITNLDSTLTKEGMAADAAAVGERFDSLDTVVAVDENSDGNIEIRSYLPEQDYLQLDKSLTVEGAAAEGAATGIAISKSSAPYNYLDNSDFRNPVNQRGEASYQFDSGYTIDRWKMHWSGDGTLTINDGYITLYRATHQAYLIQNIPTEARLFGKTVTLAAKVRGKGHIGQIFESTDVRDTVHFTSSEWMIALYTFVVPTYSFDTHVFNGIEIRNSGDESIDVEWIALYEGEYTEETLPEYKPKGYGAELAECLRYYQKGVRVNALHAADSYFAVSYMHRMRIAPTVTPQRFDFYGKGSLKDFTECEFGVNNSQLQYAYLPTIVSSSAWASGFRGALTVDLNADL